MDLVFSVTALLCFVKFRVSIEDLFDGSEIKLRFLGYLLFTVRRNQGFVAAILLGLGKLGCPVENLFDGSDK